jgi:hypothetical protein
MTTRFAFESLISNLEPLTCNGQPLRAVHTLSIQEN